ncbi:hypothetical protein [Streptomyces spirodelae]|uniref:Helix-turn-helix domain-containing protein n=1 Tax=Streptomyces spirodelae TaxID=2812904 RepID=A0ABS3X1E2_9ACTN|nr:hypothetical protein [Streptomyces spirodelae]MBO8189205.1 hypothetical protein [Streptomyces spirodelae]
MSLEAMCWVMSGDAPVADVNEFAVLGTMADKADPDGCGAWLSKETIAARAHISEETVKRCWRNMKKRGLIARGDQSLVRHYRADKRPVVWDLLIPYAYFSNVERINAERARLGRDPLTPEDRPPIAPPPPKKARADKGKKRPKDTTSPKDPTSEQRGNSQTPRDGAPSAPSGGTTSRQRGNYKLSAGELTDPQSRKGNQSDTREESRPSVPTAEVGAREPGTDGGTDGGGAVEVQEESSASTGGRASAPASSPGVDLLMQVGTAHPDRMLAGYGTALRDVGLLVTGRLEEGWSRESLWALLTAPLPQPLTHTPAAILAKRLTRLPSTPPTGPAPQVPAQPTGPAPAEQRPAPAPQQPPRCACGQLADVPGPEPRCAGCAGWPECEGGCGRRMRESGTCAACEYASWPECEGGCGQHLQDGGTCDNCVYAAEMTVPTAPDGTCAGRGQHRGECGYPVRAYGMCGRCLVIAQNERRQDLDADWDAAVAAAAEAVTTEQQAVQQAV